MSDEPNDQIRYSDNGVDIAIIETILPHITLPARRYACEVGANNGVDRSNTLALEKMGWVVLCIEPNPMLESKGRAARMLWRQVAAGRVDEESHEFIAIDVPGFPDWPSGSSLSIGGIPASLVGKTDTDLHNYEMIRMDVKVRTLDRLLEEAGFPRLDVLCVDVEGTENDVMAGIDLKRWNPTIIVIEDIENTHTQAPPGYLFHNRMQFDNIYLKEEHFKRVHGLE